MQGVSRFEREGKLSLRFIGPFEVMNRVVQTTYRLLLLDHMSVEHNDFHDFVLKSESLMLIIEFSRMRLRLDLI